MELCGFIDFYDFIFFIVGKYDWKVCWCYFVYSYFFSEFRFVIYIMGKCDFCFKDLKGIFG